MVWLIIKQHDQHYKKTQKANEQAQYVQKHVSNMRNMYQIEGIKRKLFFFRNT